MIQDQVPEPLGGERLDRVVAVVAGVTRAEAASLVDDGRVRVDGVVVTARARKVAAGSALMVEVRPAVAAVALSPDPSVVFTVVHEDPDLLVVDKPAGLVVHPGSGNQTGTLVHGLLARYPELAALAVGDTAERPGIVHRLDKGTSGLLMVGRNAETVRALVGQLSSRSVSRHYQALAWGRFEATHGLVDAPVGRSDADPTRMTVSAHGREARTRYAVLRAFEHPDPTTLLECWLETGRTHQIRVHLSAIGHPVVGDARYGGTRGAVHSPRPWLHAFSLAFVHPRTGEELHFESPVPEDLQAVLRDLS